MRKSRRAWRWALPTGVAILVLLPCAFVIGLRGWTHAAYAKQVYTSADAVPAATTRPRVAIVFGAGLWKDAPSPLLYDRVETGVNLYRAGKVHKLLLTGDNRVKNYNEPAVMKQTAMRLGVPEEDLVLDLAGRRTYDSCYRAREIFGLGQAVLVTQKFHLYRALYICDSLGVDSIGVTADLRAYPRDVHLSWWVRDVMATVLAWSDLNLVRPAPVLGERLPIGDTTGGTRPEGSD